MLCFPLSPPGEERVLASGAEGAWGDFTEGSGWGVHQDGLVRAIRGSAGAALAVSGRVGRVCQGPGPHGFLPMTCPSPVLLPWSETTPRLHQGRLL